MQIENYPIWIQWILILVCSIPILVVWSGWEMFKEKVKISGQRCTEKWLGIEQKPPEPIAGMKERIFGKIVGFIIFVGLIYMVSYPTLMHISETIEIIEATSKIFGLIVATVGVIKYASKHEKHSPHSPD